MLTGLSLALYVVKLLNMIAGFLSDEDKAKTAVALREADNLKNDLAVIEKANAARAAVPVDDVSLRTPNADSRPS